MNETNLEPIRRYACKACQRVFLKWVPRCSCGKWEIVLVEDAPAAPIVAAPTYAPPSPSSSSAVVPTTPPGPPRLAMVPPPVEHPDPEPEDDDDNDDDDNDNDNDDDDNDNDDDDDNDPIALCDIEDEPTKYERTGVAPLDDVLGGGVAEDAVILLGGTPGAGKSSLLMQALDGIGMRCLYATGEESVKQVGVRARRLDVASKRVSLVAESDLDRVFRKARKMRAELIAIDSIQTLTCSGMKGQPGSPGQIKECTGRLVTYAKNTGTPIIIICHVTNEGDLSGPRTLKHLVDVVLEMDVGSRCHGTERILRCLGKNRFGPSNVVGHFKMTDSGLVPLKPEDVELDFGDDGDDGNGN